MKVYSYKNIKCITRLGITFMDGYNIVFEECRKERSKAKKLISQNHTVLLREICWQKNHISYFILKIESRSFLIIKVFSVKREIDISFINCI